MRFDTVDQILDFAIEQEQAAHDLYKELAGMVTRPGMKQTFLELAEMEMEHRRKLEGIKAGELPGFTPERAQDLKIAETLVDVDPAPNMTYQEALLFAMKAEQRAHDLYVGLAGATSDPTLRETFKGLAQEELKHKLLFETEYDEVILEGN